MIHLLQISQFSIIIMKNISVFKYFWPVNVHYDEIALPQGSVKVSVTRSMFVCNFSSGFTLISSKHHETLKTIHPNLLVILLVFYAHHTRFNFVERKLNAT